MNGFRALLCALVCVPATALLPGAPAQAAFACRHLEADTRRAMAGWQVPGLAVGIVRDGVPVARFALGVRDAEIRLPVTPKTLFGTGSLTKSLTALGIAVAAQENRVRLDRPVQQVLPYFPAGVSLRHLLSHTAGWPRHDALWYLDRYGRRELTEKLALLPRFARGGKAFQYNNVPFAAAGVALAEATGTTWDAWIRAKILDPAGMTDAVTTLAGFRNAANRAAPYFPAADGRISVPLRDTDPVGPAAGLYAHLDDMLKYLALLATDGLVGRTRRLPAAAIRTIRTPVTPRYGLGLRIATWNGAEMAFHPGFIDGYGARLSILPGSGSGVVVLSNLSGETPAAQIVSQTALDCLTGAARTDWVARFGHRRPPPEMPPPPPAPSPPERDAAVYTGSFDHAAYGRLEFRTAGSGQLAGRFHGRDFRLDYAGQDRWRLTETHWPLREGLVFAFEDPVAGAPGVERFARVSAPLADGPTYRHNAGPISFDRTVLHSPATTPD